MLIGPVPATGVMWVTIMLMVDGMSPNSRLTSPEPTVTDRAISDLPSDTWFDRASSHFGPIPSTMTMNVTHMMPVANSGPISMGCHSESGLMLTNVPMTHETG